MSCCKEELKLENCFPTTGTCNCSAFEFTAFFDAGSTTLTVIGTPSGTFALGQTIVGPGIPPGTTILGISVDPVTGVITLTISNATTAASAVGGTTLVDTCPFSFTITGTTAAGSPIVTDLTFPVSGPFPAVCQAVSGVGIPAGTVITGLGAPFQGLTSATVVSQGDGLYSDMDVVTVLGGTGTPATLQLTVVGGVITAVTVLTAGIYTVPPTSPFSVVGGTGTGATFNGLFADEFTITGVSVPATGTGSGYTVGDTLTLTTRIPGSTATRATVTVTSVSGTGAVTGVALANGGLYSLITTNPSPVTGGSGNDDALITITNTAVVPSTLILSQPATATGTITITILAVAPIPIFDATLGLAPLFSVVSITNTGTCVAEIFAQRAFETLVLPTVVPPPIFPPTDATLAPGLIGVIQPRSCATFTIKDMTLLWALCVSVNGSENCSLSVKIKSKYCVPSCVGAACGPKVKTKVIEDCCTLEGTCASAATQTIFNSSASEIPKFSIFQVSNSGTCSAILQILRSFDSTFQFLFPTALPGVTSPGLATLFPNQTIVFVVTDIALLQAICVPGCTDLVTPTCSLTTNLKALFCIPSCEDSKSSNVFELTRKKCSKKKSKNDFFSI